MSATDTAAPSAASKMSLPTLTAMVVGSMVGAGVFSLPARFGVATGILGSLIAWAVAGAGMLMLAFVFQNLAIRKPDLDSGVFIYAKAGFGDYAGFNSAIGFWASAVAGNTFSCEPGIYLEGRYGVRIEDAMVCTAAGGESLNESPRELRIVDGR